MSQISQNNLLKILLLSNLFVMMPLYKSWWFLDSVVSISLIYYFNCNSPDHLISVKVHFPWLLICVFFLIASTHCGHLFSHVNFKSPLYNFMFWFVLIYFYRSFWREWHLYNIDIFYHSMNMVYVCIYVDIFLCSLIEF